MLKVLIKKEILNNLLNLRFTLAYFLCTFLLVGSASIMIADYIAEKKLYEVNKNIYERWINEANRGWRYFWEEKTIAREPLPTKVLVIGGEKDPDPRAVAKPDISPFYQGNFKRNPLTNLFPTVDLSFIIGVIISLLIFMLVYDAVSGEREEGTLKVLLSCPLPRDQIIISKYLGGFISLILPFFTSWIIILLILFLIPDMSLNLEDWLRIFTIFMLSTLYISVIFSLAMTVSSICRNSATSILILLFVWVIGIVVIPAVSTPTAYLITNPPGVQEQQIAARRIGIVQSATVDKRLDEYVKKHFGDRNESKLSQKEQAELKRVKDQWWFVDFANRVDSIGIIGNNLSRLELQVDRISRSIVRFSPYGCFQNACVSLANTGMQRELNLRQSMDTFNKSSFEFGRKIVESGIDRLDPSHGPRHTLQKTSIVASIQSSFFDITLLLVMGILFFLIGYIGFLRIEIT